MRSTLRWPLQNCPRRVENCASLSEADTISQRKRDGHSSSMCDAATLAHASTGDVASCARGTPRCSRTHRCERRHASTGTDCRMVCLRRRSIRSSTSAMPRRPSRSAVMRHHFPMETPVSLAITTADRGAAGISTRCKPRPVHVVDAFRFRADQSRKRRSAHDLSGFDISAGTDHHRDERSANCDGRMPEWAGLIVSRARCTRAGLSRRR